MSGRSTVDPIIEWSFPTSASPATGSRIPPTAQTTVNRATSGDRRRRLRRLAAVSTCSRTRGNTRRQRCSVVVVTATARLASQGVVSQPILDTPPAAERSELLERSRMVLDERGIGATLVAADADPAEALIQAAWEEEAEMISLVGHTGAGYVARAARLDSRERPPSRAVRRAGGASPRRLPSTAMVRRVHARGHTALSGQTGDGR